MTPHHLVLAFVYFFVLLVILPIYSSDKVYSMHYQEDPVKTSETDAYKREHRKKGVEGYLKQVRAQESYIFHASRMSEPVDNLVIVLAKKPTHEEDLVLSQLVAEVDRSIRQEKLYRSALIICNTSRMAYKELEDLARLYPVMAAVNTTEWKLFNNEEIIRHDFVDCLRQGIQRAQFKYVTLIRDLVVPFPGFIGVVNQMINQRMGADWARGELVQSSKPWLFLHLHEPVPFRHYEFTGDCFHEILVITCSGAAIFFMVFRWLEGPQQSTYSGVIYAGYGALFFLTFTLVLGRPYISEMRRTAGEFYRVYDPPQPVHFSATTIPKEALFNLLPQLSLLRCSSYSPFHRALDHMVTTLEMPGYVISPSLFKYVARS